MLCGIRYHFARALPFLLVITFFGLHLNNVLGAKTVKKTPSDPESFTKWFLVFWDQLAGDFREVKIHDAQQFVPSEYRKNLSAASGQLIAMHDSATNSRSLTKSEKKRFHKLYGKIKDAVASSDSLNRYFNVITLRHIPASLVDLWRKIEVRQLKTQSTEPCFDEKLNLKIPQSKDGPDICFSMEILEEEANEVSFPTDLLVNMTLFLIKLDTDYDYRNDSGVNFAAIYQRYKQSVDSMANAGSVKNMIQRIADKMMPRLLHEVFKRIYAEVNDYASNITGANRMLTVCQVVKSVAKEKEYPDKLLEDAAKEIIMLKLHTSSGIGKKFGLASQREFYTEYLLQEIADVSSKDPLRYEIDSMWGIELHNAIDRLWQNVDNLENYQIEQDKIASIAQNSLAPLDLIESKVKHILTTADRLRQPKDPRDFNDAVSTFALLRDQLKFLHPSPCRIDRLFFQLIPAKMPLPRLEGLLMLDRAVSHLDTVQNQASTALQHNQSRPTSLSATGIGLRVPEVGESSHTPSLDVAIGSASAPLNDKFERYSDDLRQVLFATSPLPQEESLSQFDIQYLIRESDEKTLRHISDFLLNDGAPSNNQNHEANQLSRSQQHEGSMSRLLVGTNPTGSLFNKPQQYSQQDSASPSEQQYRSVEISDQLPDADSSLPSNLSHDEDLSFQESPKRQRMNQ